MHIETNGIGLGDEVKDRVTGFMGIVIGVTQYANGCARIGLQPPIDKDGKVPDASWFDVVTLDVTRAKHIDLSPAPTGGPRPDPRRFGA